MYIIQQPFKDILAGIHTALLVNEGIVKVTGGPGTGKSALCAQLYRDLEERGQPVIFFMNPPRDAESLQHDILHRLDLPTTGNFTRTLTRSLLAQPPVRNALILLFDDAQDIDARTFTSIRMLCNIQDDSKSLVRMVICGTEELDRKLASAEFRGISQYLNQSFRLDNLTREQVQDFRSAWWLARGQVVTALNDRELQQLYRSCKGRLSELLDILLAEAQALDEQRARRERQEAAELEVQRERAREVAAAEAAAAKAAAIVVAAAPLEPLTEVPATEVSTTEVPAKEVSTTEEPTAEVSVTALQAVAEEAGPVEPVVAEPVQEETTLVAFTPAEPIPAEILLDDNGPAVTPLAEAPSVASPPEVAVAPEPEPPHISAADVALVVEGIDQLVRPRPLFTRPRVYSALAVIMVLLTGAAVVHYIDFTPPPAPLVVTTNPPVQTPIAVQPTIVAPAPVEQPAPETADEPVAVEVQAVPEAEIPEATIPEATVAEAEPLPAPVPEPVLPVAAEPPLAAQVDTMLAAWTDSWQRQDLPGYFSHYHQAFVPEPDPDVAAWRERRQASISRASEIAISIDSLAIQESADDSVTVQFWLRYRAQGYADDTLKEIRLQQSDGRWLISSERNLQTQRL